jgi:creatinine amidohydrolase/Fe(II)-dependent formamide hydrolase-like protein
MTSGVCVTRASQFWCVAPVRNRGWPLMSTAPSWRISTVWIAGCLGVASKARARSGSNTLDACVSGLPEDVQRKMEERVKRELK